MNRFKITQEYPDVQVISWTSSSETFSVISKINERYKLVLVEDGAGVLNIKGRQETFIAPAIFCFDELEKPKLIRGINLSVRLLYFHPRIINSSYSFELLRNIDGISDFSIRSNRQLLRAFFDKNPEYVGLLNMNGVNGKSVAYLLNAIQGEINNGNNTYIRTVLFELLILIQKIFYEYFYREKINQTSTLKQSAINLFDGMESQIPDSDDAIKEIINYLNANRFVSVISRNIWDFTIVLISTGFSVNIPAVHHRIINGDIAFRNQETFIGHRFCRNFAKKIRYCRIYPDNSEVKLSYHRLSKKTKL